MTPQRLEEIYNTICFSDPIQREICEELFEYIEYLQNEIEQLQDVVGIHP